MNIYIQIHSNSPALLELAGCSSDVLVLCSCGTSQPGKIQRYYKSGYSCVPKFFFFNLSKEIYCLLEITLPVMRPVIIFFEFNSVCVCV